MTTTLDTLNKILENIQNNQKAVATQLVASTKAYGDVPADVEAAINLLIKHYGENVQLIGHAIGAKLQIAQLDATSTEINALIGAMQVVLSNEATVTQVDKVLNGFPVGPQSPLSDAAGDSQLAAANQAAPVETAPVVTGADESGTPELASPPVDGTTAS